MKADLVIANVKAMSVVVKIAMNAMSVQILVVMIVAENAAVKIPQ